MTTINTDLPVLNVDLLTDLVKWAGQEEAHLERVYQAKGWPIWYQGAWIETANGGDFTVCGTKACIAGNAVIQSDQWVPAALFTDFTTGRYPYDPEKFHWLAVPVEVTGTMPNGQPIYVRDESRGDRAIEEVAGEVLGINSYEAGALFNGDNSLADVVHLARLIAGSRGVVLDLPPELENRGDESDWCQFDDGSFCRRRYMDLED